jgi:hypothetical protein
MNAEIFFPMTPPPDTGLVVTAPVARMRGSNAGDFRTTSRSLYYQ